MPRHLPLALLLAVAAPTVAAAQDFCAVLNATLAEMVEARNAVTEASASIDDLRFRLSEDRGRYRDDLADLADPSEDAEIAGNQLGAAVGSLNELRARRCPSIPDGR